MRNKYNIFISIITILILSEIASASIIASKEEPLIFVYDGGKINLTSNQTFDRITTTRSSLNISMNGSYLNLTSNTSKNLSNISIVNSTDTLTFNASGDNGYLNFTVLMNKSLTVYGIKFDGSLLESKSTNADKQLIYNYTGVWSEHTFSVENITGAASNGTPNITKWYNNISGWNQTTMNINAGNNATFNVTVNQTITSVSWKVENSQEQNTSSLEFTRRFNTVGSFNVTMQAFNENGSSNIINTTVTVTESGGGGTNWDWATFNVNYLNGTGVNNALVATTAGNFYTNALGIVSTGYVFEDGQTYWINVSKAGHDPNNTQLLFNEDHEVMNITLNISSSPAPTPTPSSNYNYTVAYKYNCSETRSGGVSFEFIKMFNATALFIIVVLLIFILRMTQENPVIGIISSVVIIVFVGSLLPSIAGWSNEVACISTSESHNVSGHADTWISLGHSNIKNDSETISNSSYTGIKDNDYNMDYILGRFRPLSTGNFSFG